MGLLADDARLDRRSGLRALLIILALLAVGFGIAWVTLGRTAKFQSLKGVYLSFDVPRSFVQIDEEGAGESLTSLGKVAEVERTYSVVVPPERACRSLGRSFRAGQVDVVSVPPTSPSVECSYSGTVGGFSVGADVRTPAAFLEHVTANDVDLPELPSGARSVASIFVRD